MIQIKEYRADVLVEQTSADTTVAEMTRTYYDFMRLTRKGFRVRVAPVTDGSRVSWFSGGLPCHADITEID